MNPGLILALCLTWVASVAACGAYLRLARYWQILDRPNDRSSHLRPTPHGGGAALLAALVAGAAGATLAGVHWDQGFVLVLGLAVLLMAVGVFDDLYGLPVRLRFALYALCCVLAAVVLLADWGALAIAVAALCLLWLLNLYNFMDGIDGIAASQCVLACSAAALLSWLYGGGQQYMLFCLLLAATHAGFLVWNWPPARLFMGDAGSVPTGFLLGALALLGERRGDLPAACWLILLAAFITDTTVTLLWRAVTGQAITRPHRLHAYQRLSRVLGGHRPVVLWLLALHLVWLYPLAASAAIFPEIAPILVILAYIPLLGGMAKVLKVG